MKKKGRIILWTVVAVVVCAVVVYVIVKKTGGKETVTFDTTVVTRGDISDSVTATGTIEPVTEVEVGTQVSGIIDKIYVDYNSEVKKGDLIAEMDKSTLLLDMQSSQANYQSAEAEYNYQKKNYERQKALYDKGLISDQDYDEAEYNYLRSEASYKSSEAELARAERELSYATINSPIDGVVIEKSVEEGQTVAAGFETPTLFYIAADLTKMKVVADVDEADIGGVEVGQRVSFTVDAYPDDTFEGRVEQIRLGSTLETSTTTESVITYEVVIYADNPDLKLLPRLTANIDIYVVDKHDVLCVPSKALRFSMNKELAGDDAVINDCDAAHKVWTKQGNVFTAHAVEIGLNNGATTEIVSGIAEGTEVITAMNVTTTKEAKKASTVRSPFAPGPPDRDSNKGSEDEEEEE